MPEMKGTELLEIAKQRFPDTMRFIITAFTDYETVVDSINVGEIYGFFNKPFDNETVRMALVKAIEVYNLRIANRKLLSEMERMNNELKDLDRNKTKYLSILTNEIRSPINKIISAVHMLKDRVDSGDLSELIFYLDTSVSKLESFSVAANQLARLNEGILSKMEQKEVSLSELIEVSMLENKNQLDRFGVTVEYPGMDADISVTGDLSLLLTCLGTLLRNSAEHSGRNSTIKLNAFETEAEKAILLNDPGELYTKNQVENIIQFLSGSAKTNDFTPGIDLILARQIMVSHGGRIELHYAENNSISTKMLFPSGKGS
jgi:K+-sensing histidine kinase KdpD